MVLFARRLRRRPAASFGMALRFCLRVRLSWGEEVIHTVYSFHLLFVYAQKTISKLCKLFVFFPVVWSRCCKLPVPSPSTGSLQAQNTHGTVIITTFMRSLTPVSWRFPLINEVATIQPQGLVSGNG
ncbi:hypothetical protein B0J13DRAFT_3535 [Dactylonectria estremocensis]|uniref:Uncharacterized protein n=1 Tax=Dactylonectria estremocensis TaxID=1079267 RepID=A0A9P9FH80_9HYPO|nr:hypothetical protein B0J13DRAFT_3535 [Dactylonectria estremocensis]